MLPVTTTAHFKVHFCICKIISKKLSSSYPPLHHWPPTKGEVSVDPGFQIRCFVCWKKGSLQCLHLISPLTPMSKVLLELLPGIFSLFAPFHISPSSPAGGTQNKKSWWWEFVELDLETWNLDQGQDNVPLLFWSVWIKSHIQKRISHKS